MKIPQIVNYIAPLVVPSLITRESLRIMDYCFFVNSDKAKKDLNYRLTPITEALKETVKEL